MGRAYDAISVLRKRIAEIANEIGKKKACPRIQR